jgi:hypothetical protein
MPKFSENNYETHTENLSQDKTEYNFKDNEDEGDSTEEEEANNSGETDSRKDDANHLTQQDGLDQDLIELIESLEQIPGFEAELDKIVQELLSSNYQSAEHLIIKILRRYFSAGDGIDKTKLGQALTKEISSIIGISKGEDFKGVSGELRKKLTNKKRRSKQIKNKDSRAERSSQELRRLKELLRKQVIYAAYKFKSPHRIAGETSKQNFMNNVSKRGLARAIEYAGGEEKASNLLTETTPKKLNRREKTHLDKIKNQKSSSKGIS